MNRMLELALIHEQADRLAVHIFGECVVAVTGEAILVFQFVLGLDRATKERQTEYK